MGSVMDEYYIDDTALAEWLPWGGLIRSSVVRNKDDSFLAVMRYKKNHEIPDEKLESFSFAKGWIIYAERQFFEGHAEDYFILCWNPFLDTRDVVSNTLNKKPVTYQKADLYFEGEVYRLAEVLRQFAEVEVLENADVLNYLASSLSMKKETYPLPDVPLYLDVLLSQDLDFKILPNRLQINSLNMAVVTPLAMGQFEDSFLKMLFDALEGFQYRFSRRMLLFDSKSADKTMKHYMNNWCEARSEMQKFVKFSLDNELQGYYTNTFVFFNDSKEDYARTLDVVKQIFEIMHMTYIFEEKNFKDVWWGSLPGLFRANLVPPLQGTTLKRFLLPVYQNADKEEPYVQNGSIQQE